MLSQIFGTPSGSFPQKELDGCIEQQNIIEDESHILILKSEENHEQIEYIDPLVKKTKST